MPDQPDDPIHYEMKIPPEPKKPEESGGRESSVEGQGGSNEVTSESDCAQEKVNARKQPDSSRDSKSGA
jgi:hypothetical protein